MNRLLLFFLFFRWYCWGFKTQSNLSQVTQLVELKSMPVCHQRQNSSLTDYIISQKKKKSLMENLVICKTSFCCLALLECSSVSTRLINSLWSLQIDRRCFFGYGCGRWGDIGEIDSWADSKEFVPSSSYIQTLSRQV